MSQPVVFEPGGYARHQGAAISDRERLQAVTLLFASMLLRGWRAKLRMVSFFLPALGFAIYAYVRTALAQFALPPAEHGKFLLDNLHWIFVLNTVQLLIASAAQTAPLLARDAHAGALLLYFSRPLLRPQYLLARWLSTAGLSALLLALPALLYLLTHGATLGFAVQGTALGDGLTGAVLPLAGVLVVVASAAMAGAASLVALACGTITKAPATAPLLFGGSILASMAGSFVLGLAVSAEGWPRAINLYRALQGPIRAALALLRPAGESSVAWWESLLGIGVWGGLAFGAWVILQRFLANPPLGKGRA